MKNTQLGDAYVPKDPETEKPFPDHALRMDAADRIVDLFGGKPGTIEMPSEPPKGLTVIIRKDTSAKVAGMVNPTGRTRIVPEGETKHPALPVRIVKELPHDHP